MELKDRYPVFLYNTLKKQKEKFQPHNPPLVGMYVCGPTVYGDPHLGHARGAITFDVVFRYLSALQYKVRYVRNITDVGHLEDEVMGEGEDKIAKKAKLEKLEPMEVVQNYTRSYHTAMDKLNVLPPSIEPTATGHILEQIRIIKDTLENGYAYEVNGSVYFDLEKYAKTGNYGELSGKVLEELMSGSRETEGLDEKRSQHDFALWKKAKPEHIMKWESPWGMGFPGWHMECTAMSAKYLGVPFDIHGGGMDLQFPHHECEIAQSVGAFNQAPVKYWMHNNMLTINGQKMSKSLGNFITLEELFSGNHKLLEKGYHPMTVRFFILQAHYGSPLDFSNEALQAAEKGLEKLNNAAGLLDKLQHPGEGDINDQLNDEITKLNASCYGHMSDDFNTAKTLASLFEMASKIHAFHHRQLDLSQISSQVFEEVKATFLTFADDILGVKGSMAASQDGEELSRSLLELLLEIRNDARKQKDFATSDKIRDQLQELNVDIKDEKGGTSYTIKR